MTERPPVAADNKPPLDGVSLARGVSHLFHDLGFCVLVEFPLGTGRRVDVAGLHRDGAIAIAEVKTTVTDFRADKKWPEYLAFCDRFYFAVPEGFPFDVLPERAGLIVADRFGGSVLRPAPAAEAVAPARRKAFTLRFARTAAFRLSAAIDPTVPRVQDLE